MGLVRPGWLVFDYKSSLPYYVLISYETGGNLTALNRACSNVLEWEVIV